MSDNNNLPQKRDNADLVLQKADSLLAITNKILTRRDNRVVAESQIKEVSTQQRIGKFIVQDGIATDTETGLTWLRFAHGQRWQNNTTKGELRGFYWKTAFEVAKQFNQQGGYAGFTDWRLPTIEELKTLIDKFKGKEGNYIDADVFPNNVSDDGWRYWSSSLIIEISSFAWGIDFDDGYNVVYDKGYDHYVRLVRGGQ